MKTITKLLATYLVLLGILFQNTSCEKYLDAKSDASLVIPRYVKELQGLLDNGAMYKNYPVGAIVADDNLYYPDQAWVSANEMNQRSYLWDATIDLLDEYEAGYDHILWANIALSTLPDLNDHVSPQDEYDNVRGSALFYRAFNFYEMAQLFAPPYSKNNASLPLGIPLKLSPDVEDVAKRSTIQETYDRIVYDLKESANLLPSTIIHKSRPSKVAAYAELAKTYLLMAEYDSSLRYANLCLGQYDSLLDYNNSSEVDLVAPLLAFKALLNPEVIFHGTSRANTNFRSNNRVDTLLYNSYDGNDLRKRAFYAANGSFKGSYSGTTINLFAGLSTNEVYLIRAESYARTGNVVEAMDDLNTLLQKRYFTGTFTPLTATNSDEALNIILQERRKELAFRVSIRWSDLRRLNLEPQREKTLTRVIDGQSYQLLPSDPRYTFLIPQKVIDISGIAQNPR